MRRAPRTLSPTVLALVLPVLLGGASVACGDDGSGSGRASSAVVLTDHAQVMPAGSGLPADLCARIPAADNVELNCTDSRLCGDGGVCVQPIGGDLPACSQVCFPEPPAASDVPDGFYPQGWDTSFGGCGNSCPEGQTCATLLDDAGNPRLFDINVDGAPDVVGGACQSGAVGDRGAFASCGDDGVCGEGLRCLTLPGRSAGTCFPECDGVCQPFQTYPARCSATTAGSEVCLIACEPTSPAPCPVGLECVETAQGNFTCLR